MPMPKLPNFSLVYIAIPDAFGIAVVIFAVHISLAKMLAKKNNYTVDPGQVKNSLFLSF